MHHLDNKQKGYIALVTVLVVSAAGMVVGLGLISLGNAFTQTSLTLIRANQAKGLANACTEYALGRILATNFAGSGNLTETTGTCTYTVTSQGGQNRTIDASGNSSGVIRKVRVTISSVLPKVTISSWQEVSD